MCINVPHKIIYECIQNLSLFLSFFISLSLFLSLCIYNEHIFVFILYVNISISNFAWNYSAFALISSCYI